VGDGKMNFSMEFLGIIFQIIAFLLAILAVAILTWVNKDKSHSKKLLVILLLILAILNANGVVFHLGWYMKFPWMHKMAIPFSLLIAPFAFLYIRAILNGELTFRKHDWLLLLPAILFALNLWPYYTMPIADKKAYLVEYYQKSSLRSSDSEGFLPAYIFQFIRAGWSIYFIVINYRLISRFKKQAKVKVLSDNQGLIKWLQILNGLLTGLIFAALFVAVIAPIKKTAFNLLDLSLGTFVLSICVQLFIRPKFLYGIFKPSPNQLIPVSASLQAKVSDLKGKEDADETEIELLKQGPQLIITEEDAFRYKQLIEKFFIEHQPYLSLDYSLEQLVKDINVPRYILSAVINREYGMGFREFLNRYRVEYLIKNKDRPDWKNYTLEAIAAQCGFKSRVTFINNFKQITGKSPSEFFKNRSLDVPGRNPEM
jgi:AraC-like DNA-binding protein